MQLYVWKGDFGLPTLQNESLQVLAYCKISDAQINVNYRRFPLWNCSWAMPVLIDGKETLHGASDIIQYLKRVKNINPDVKLTPLQISETLALKTMLESKLKPALEFLWWLDSVNFEGLTRKWYWHLMPFPLCYFYVNNRLAYAETCMNSLFLEDDSVEMRKTSLNKNAADCLETLSHKLPQSDSGFIFGQYPTSVDALLYAHLFPLLKIPFPSDQLKRSLSQYGNIVRYLERVSKKLYPNLTYEDRFGIWKQSATVVDPDNESLSKANIVMSVAMVSVTMLAYGVSNGIIQVPKFIGRMLR